MHNLMANNMKKYTAVFALCPTLVSSHDAAQPLEVSRHKMPINHNTNQPQHKLQLSVTANGHVASTIYNSKVKHHISNPRQHTCLQVITGDEKACSHMRVSGRWLHHVLKSVSQKPTSYSCLFAPLFCLLAKLQLNRYTHSEKRLRRKAPGFYLHSQGRAATICLNMFTPLLSEQPDTVSLYMEPQVGSLHQLCSTPVSRHEASQPLRGIKA